MNAWRLNEYDRLETPVGVLQSIINTLVLSVIAIR